jgi:hypothetical protein
VSQIRFTPITSNLLARKGDAAPSAVAGKPSLVRANGGGVALVAGEQSGRVVEPPAPTDTAKPHRMMVTLSASEFEKLGIAAVKKGVTRHQMVRTALDLYLEQLKREFGNCTCMTLDGTCMAGCGAG